MKDTTPFGSLLEPHVLSTVVDTILDSLDPALIIVVPN